MTTRKNKFRPSVVCRVIGGSSKRQSKILDQCKHLRKKEKYSFEGNKTSDEKSIVAAILRFFPEFLKQYHICPLRLTTGHVHILERKSVPVQEQKNFLVRSYGTYTFGQGIDVFREPEILHFAETIVHELVHAHSWHALTVRGSTITIRRLGFQVYGRTDIVPYFGKLNEAITTELAKRFDTFCFHRIPQLRQALKLREESRGRQRKSTAREVASVHLRQFKNGKWQCTIHTYSYRPQRKKLRELIEVLYQENKEKFSSREEVFTLFAQAALGGNLMPIARVIEKTLGKGAFRKLVKRISLRVTATK